MENVTTDTPASPERPASILVVGSLNMDLVVRCPHVPAPGETILGSDVESHPGGKGANAATAAARLASVTGSGMVAMLGAVGRDDTGAALRRNLRERGVAAGYVLEVEAPTGVALIAVADDGANSIVVAPGANSRLRPQDVERTLPEIAPAVVVLQLETPLDTVVRAAALAHAAGARVLLDPAPAPAELPAALYARIDILIPNDGELASLSGLPTGTVEEAARAAAALRGRGVGTVVVKRGEHGALIVDGGGARPIPAPRVDVVDTTGAGDCFNGALAVALLESQPLDAAVRFATHAAALSCTRLGAQEAQPTRADVESFVLRSAC